MMAEEKQLCLFEKMNRGEDAFIFLQSLLFVSFFPVGVVHSKSCVLRGKSLSGTGFWCLGKGKQIQQRQPRAAFEVGEHMELLQSKQVNVIGIKIIHRVS